MLNESNLVQSDEYLGKLDGLPYKPEKFVVSTKLDLENLVETNPTLTELANSFECLICK